MSEAEAVKPRRRKRGSEVPTTLDAIEMAMRAERNDPAPDSPARILLQKQARLLDRQTASESVSLALKVMTSIVGLVVAVALGSMMWAASNERGLVIEPFSVPPEFAQRGITGQVVASRLLDRLSEMGEQTVSVRAPSTYANNWNGDIKVQIPQTGISVGELRRYLVEWLGRQTTIGGELYKTPEGLRLSARTGTAAAATQTGASESDLEQMIQRAAESVYATTQPYRHAIYLRRDVSPEGALKSREALLRLSRSGDEADRMWAYAALNLEFQREGDFRKAIGASDAALAIAPKFNLAYANRAGALSGLGHDEAALRDLREAERTAGSHGARYMREEGLEYVNHSWRAQRTALLGDYQTALTGFRQALVVRPEDESTLASLVVEHLGLHDLSGALEPFTAIPRPESGANVHALASFAEGIASLAASFAFEAEDWASAHRLITSVDETHLARGTRIGRRNQTFPLAAIALARSGDVQAARVLIDSTPRDCYRCVSARGTIAGLAGDTVISDRWFANAVRQGPSLPFADAEWGRAKLARGDAEGAIALFEQAHRKSPRWADPLKFWGDALARTGDLAEAERKYSAAAERAPRWGALHLAWGQALAKSGKIERADVAYGAAAGMHLSVADRKLLRQLLNPMK